MWHQHHIAIGPVQVSRAFVSIGIHLISTSSSFLAFPGILNWQKRLWLTLQDFQAAREDASAEQLDTGNDAFLAEDAKLFDARNFYVKGATFNYRHAHQLSVAISKMQGLTNSLRVSSLNEAFSVVLHSLFSSLACSQAHTASGKTV